MPFLVIGFSHRSSPITVRERFAFPEAAIPQALEKLRRDAGASIEAVSAFLDHSSLAVTTVYLRRLEGETDRTWPDVAVAIGV